MAFVLSSGASSARLMDIPSGEDGIRATLKEMARISKEYKIAPLIRSLAAKIYRDVNLSQGDFWGEVKACHAFVRDCIRYMGDTLNVDTLQTPEVTLNLESGDCDDKCMLLAALLCSTNHPTRFLAIGMNGRGFSHVICETYLAKRWIPLETCRNVKAGWRPPNITSRLYANV